LEYPHVRDDEPVDHVDLILIVIDNELVFFQNLA